MAERPVTKKELDESLAQLADRLQEMVRDAQTEILRGFEAYARAHEIRMRKL
ncbi:MAG: hypothetical protein HYS04_05060 [Acidobacteria bacterium]|nr:hypothetical protein [Acidobacteriota bacterium]